MFTMMLNFMIAVIEDTYNDVENVEDILISKGKAELNIDYFELKDVFFKLSEYRVLLFTTDIAVQKGHTVNYDKFTESLTKEFDNSKHRDCKSIMNQLQLIKQSNSETDA